MIHRGDIPDLAPGIAAFFAPEGALARSMPGYEERVQQRDLSLQIGDALRSGHTLVAEAGTGTGKTLAYLVPALASGLRVVVSTGTKTLQEQLLQQDVPRLQKAAQRNFDVVVLKGRTNYLCEARFESLVGQGTLPGMDVDADLQQVRAWRERTHSGDRSELRTLPDDAAVWRHLTVSSEQCTGRKCEHYERCWVTRIRQRAQEAQLVVVNHHLYFADAALKQRARDAAIGILPPHDVVIFDEAHEVEEIASQYFGLQVSESRFTDLTQDIARAEGTSAKLHTLLVELDLRVRHLFDALPFSEHRHRLRRADVSEAAVGRFTDLSHSLQRLEAQLHEMDGDELPALRRRAAELSAELAFVLYQPHRASVLADIELPTEPPPAEEEDQRPADQLRQGRVPFVRFTEHSLRNRALVARPLDVAPLFQQAVRDLPAVFTSATLAIGRSCSHFRRRLGLANAQEFIADSPFDYARQCRLYLPTDLPDVSDPDFTRAATQRLMELITASQGGAFVLCTSNRMVDLLRTTLRQATPLRVLVQGSAPRSHLVEQFKEDGDAVLIATMSFWRGVDVPGRALRLVAIDRLPFAAPTDPMVEARLEYLRQQGRSPFTSYQLPQATLLLRQGFGRLVRSRSDQGLVTILDRRITSKAYGRLFLRSLPRCPRTDSLAQACDYLARVAQGVEAPVD